MVLPSSNGEFHALDQVIRYEFAAPIHHLVELVAEADLDGMVVVKDRVLRHAVGLDGVIVMGGRGGVGALLLREPGERLGCSAASRHTFGSMR